MLTVLTMIPIDCKSTNKKIILTINNFFACPQLLIIEKFVSQCHTSYSVIFSKYEQKAV